MRAASRNPSLIRGIGKFSRSKMYHKRGIWAIKAKNGGSFPHHDPKPAEPAPSSAKLPKFYPADDVKTPIPNRRKPKPTKLRYMDTPPSLSTEIVWNYVLGFESHLILDAVGPFKINGVPLRRVNQSYVIATSTKVDISGVNADKFGDKYFTKERKEKTKKGEGEFFETEKEVCSRPNETKALPQEKKDDQKAVDSPLIKAIEAVPDLKAYLGARFSLSRCSRSSSGSWRRRKPRLLAMVALPTALLFRRMPRHGKLWRRRRTTSPVLGCARAGNSWNGGRRRVPHEQVKQNGFQCVPVQRELLAEGDGVEAADGARGGDHPGKHLLVPDP
ncbi:hypothetical protein BHE74_00026422 [Ensete ventricosum]|nr:hypothetical protein BHE74_00026422 [Ensete ventricosum]